MTSILFKIFTKLQIFGVKNTKNEYIIFSLNLSRGRSNNNVSYLWENIIFKMISKERNLGFQKFNYQGLLASSLGPSSPHLDVRQIITLRISVSLKLRNCKNK